MVRLSRPIPLLLLAAAAVSATPGQTSSNALSSANHLEARTLSWLWNWATGHARQRCPVTFRCDGSGRDGYEYDIWGNSRPSWAPHGWRYFGTSVGWAPVLGWENSLSWSFPIQFKATCSRVTWWAPTPKWQGALDLEISLPSWWIIWPSKSWVSIGSGLDGQIYDYNGKTCDTRIYPKGWLWFGLELGWLPPRGFVPAVDWIPSASAEISLGHAHWWLPPLSWNIPAHLHIPVHWRPSVDWQCSGSGLDGWRWDFNGVGKPSWAPAGWLWWGGSIGWGPSKTWTCGSSWVMPSQWTKSCGKVTWWKPPVSWTPPATISIPSWWPQHPHKTTSVRPAPTTTPRITTTKKVSSTIKKVTTTTQKAHTTTTKAAVTTKKTTTKAATTTHKVSTTTHKAATTTQKPVSTPKPSGGSSSGGADWQCDGSGKDGKEVDHNGHGCPSQYPSGWLWFGIEIGWSAPAGWQIPSANWEPTKVQLSACSKNIWWAPPTSWVVTAGIQVPLHWHKHGWRIPSRSWQCSATGEDGYLFDSEGNSRPVGLELGFKWFGSLGWQPCKTFVPPSLNWQLPLGWNAGLARWWSPSRSVTVPRGFKCARWWSKKHLRGHISWA